MGTEPDGLVARLREDAKHMRRATTAFQAMTWGSRLAISAKVAADRIEMLEAALRTTAVGLSKVASFSSKTERHWVGPMKKIAADALVEAGQCISQCIPVQD